MTTASTTFNRALTEAVRDEIAAHPDNFDMGLWFGRNGVDVTYRVASEDHYDHIGLEPFINHDCGTTACIAGYAFIAAKQAPPSGGISHAAADLLGWACSRTRSVTWPFFSEDWPYWVAETVTADGWDLGTSDGDRHGALLILDRIIECDGDLDAAYEEA
jgi:hypothetical protein